MLLLFMLSLEPEGRVTFQPGSAIHELDHEALEKQMLRAYVAAGVTTVLDAVAYPEDLARLRELGETQPSPQILALGLPPSLPGSYAPSVLPDMPLVTDVPSLEAHLDRVAAEDVVGLKVLQEHGLVRDVWPVLEGDLAEALVAGAEARHLPLFVHAMSGDEALEALELSPRALMHTPMREDRKANTAIAESGVFVVSTLNISASALLEFQPQLSSELAVLLVPAVLREAILDPELQAASRIAAGKVAVPRAPERLAARPIKPSVYEGMPAEMMDLDDRGSLEVGLRADLVVHSQDPRETTTAWQTPEFVVLGGELRTPADWLSD